MVTSIPQRWAWAEIDLGAIRGNVALLRAAVEPAEVWAVVKADGYGHGAVPVARAALEGGAGGLAVALVQEGVELREAGITAPILVLSEPPPDWMPAVAAFGLRPTVYTAGGIDAAAAAVASARERGAGTADGLDVHLKVDTGMRRVGAEPIAALALAQRVLGYPTLRLEGVLTHLAVADEPERPATAAQLARFDAVLERLRDHGIEPPLVHAANSAGAIAHPGARYSLVRAGIAIYGLTPGPALADATRGLRPALSLRARVSFVKAVVAGDQVSYGLRHTFAADTMVATLPLGYADGVPRRLFETGAEVLLGGRRRPIVGVVTMDQLMVDCGPDADVAVGDEAVLLGRQGDQVIGADEWAERLGTISYEIVCGISGRVPRRYVDHVGGLAEGGR